MENVPKLRDLKGKEKLTYFWDYYKWVVILIAVGIIVAITIIHAVVNKKENALYVLAVNADPYVQEEVTETLFADFLQEQGIDPQKEEVLLNTGIQYLGGTSTTDIYAMQSIVTIMGSGSADVVMMPEDLYREQASLGAFVPVQYYLSSEEMEALGDRIIWVEKDRDLTTIAEEGEDDAPGTAYARGIRMDSGDKVGVSGLYGDTPPVIGIAGASEKPELAAALVRELLGLKEAGAERIKNTGQAIRAVI